MRNANFQEDFFHDSVVIPGLITSTGAGDISDRVFSNVEMVDLQAYDRIILALSGGKDSIAALLKLIDAGVDLGKVEAWHHAVDGRDGNGHFMDWPCVEDYCVKLCEAFGIPVYFSWLRGGFKGEMLKENAISEPHMIETPTGLKVFERDASRSKKATRLMFPQQSASLQTRWCSSSLKIEIARRGLANQDRLNHSSILFITGERREESANRSRYYQLEPHQADARVSKRTQRHIDHWRPVLNWSEADVWTILEKHGVLPPVPYRLGLGRSSCQFCIFSSDRIWATLRHYFEDRFNAVADLENQFGVTISRTKKSINQLADNAKPIDVNDPAALAQATAPEYSLPIFASKDNPWFEPIGAFSNESCGSY